MTTQLTNILSISLVNNILPELNLQEVARLRSTCHQCRDHIAIKKYFEAQFNAAGRIRFHMTGRPLEECVKLTSRQICLIKMDWVKFEQSKEKALICITYGGRCPPILTLPILLDGTYKDVYRSFREYLKIDQKAIVSLNFTFPFHSEDRDSIQNEKNLAGKIEAHNRTAILQLSALCGRPYSQCFFETFSSEQRQILMSSLNQLSEAYAST